MIFAICVPNVIGLYVLAPRIRAEMNAYAAGRAAGGGR